MSGNYFGFEEPTDPPHNVQRHPVGTSAKDMQTGTFYRYEATDNGMWHWVVSEHVTVPRKTLEILIAAAEELKRISNW